MIPGFHWRAARWLWLGLAGLVPLPGAEAADRSGAVEFRRSIRPILESYCFDCHADGANKGRVAFDTFPSDQAALQDVQLWRRVLRNLRAGIMPPAKKARPTAPEEERIAHWIKTAVFNIRPDHPDPGHVRLRRLNRAEYRNTIRDLMGVDFNTQTEFPPDDTGYGFDTIGDVLTLPPMLLEKYIAAARKIVEEALPMESSELAGASAGRRPKAYEQFFPRQVPATPEARRAYATELLRDFSRRAFRRPVDEPTVARLAALAEGIYSQTNRTFEAGVAQSMVAVLASPRFLFREEQAQTQGGKKTFPFIDEYSLASRLSYFLWSSMPDEKLYGLAREGRLRANLSAEMARMLKDTRSQALVLNFTGQWLRARTSRVSRSMRVWCWSAKRNPTRRSSAIAGTSANSAASPPKPWRPAKRTSWRRCAPPSRLNAGRSART